MTTEERTVYIGACIPCDLKVRVKLDEEGEEFEVLSLEVTGTGVLPGDLIAQLSDDDYEDILAKAKAAT